MLSFLILLLQMYETLTQAEFCFGCVEMRGFCVCKSIVTCRPFRPGMARHAFRRAVSFRRFFGQEFPPTFLRPFPLPAK